MNTISMMLKKGMLGAMVLGLLMMVSSAAFAYRPAPAKVVTTKTTTTQNRGKVVTKTTTTTTTRAARPVVYQRAQLRPNHRRHHAHSRQQVVYRPVTTKRVIAQPAPARKVVVTKTTKPATRPNRGKLASKSLVLRW